jgi:hypothetical protein
VNIIKKWIEINWTQFESDKKLLNALEDFVGYLKDVNPAVSSFIDKAIAVSHLLVPSRISYLTFDFSLTLSRY